VAGKKPKLTWDNLSSRLLACFGLEIPAHCRVPDYFILAALVIATIVAFLQPKGCWLVFSGIIVVLLAFIGAILVDGRLKDD